jgi:hypothetical protein
VRRPARLERLEHGRILRGIVRDDHVGVVLRRRAQQRDAADVDLLDERAVGQGCRARFERIQRDRHEVDRLEAALLQRREIVRDLAPGENGGVHVRMQRLHTPAEQLGRARPVLDGRGRDAFVREPSRGAARRQDLRAARGERASERGGATRLGEREQRHARPAHARDVPPPCRRCIASR